MHAQRWPAPCCCWDDGISRDCDRAPTLSAVSRRTGPGCRKLVTTVSSFPVIVTTLSVDRCRNFDPMRSMAPIVMRLCPLGIQLETAKGSLLCDMCLLFIYIRVQNITFDCFVSLADALIAGRERSVVISLSTRAASAPTEHEDS